MSVTNPERVSTLLAAARTLRDATCTTFDATQALTATAPDYAMGGTRAAADASTWPAGAVSCGAAGLL